jgi:hypothetical protein
MYSQKEASALRQEFWTVFGKYMSPVLPAGGEAINWVNYKTGQKYIRFTMDAGTRDAFISIVFQHTDETERKEAFGKMKLLKDELEGEWQWEDRYTDEHGHVMSRVFATIQQVSVLNKADWPALISFFKPRLVALDRFWNDNQFIFE